MPCVHVISGMARGADTLAVDWAIVNWLTWSEFPITKADWKEHGRGAGSWRNQRMLDEGKPDLVVAFPGGSGTRDMVNRSRRQGFEVIVIGTDGSL